MKCCYNGYTFYSIYFLYAYILMSALGGYITFVNLTPLQQLGVRNEFLVAVP